MKIVQCCDLSINFVAGDLMVSNGPEMGGPAASIGVATGSHVHTIFGPTCTITSLCSLDSHSSHVPGYVLIAILFRTMFSCHIRCTCHWARCM